MILSLVGTPAAPPPSGEALPDADTTATSETLAKALARRWSLSHADLAKDPPDAAAFEASDLDVYLRHRIVPWRKIGALTAYATARPAGARDALAALKPRNGMAFIAVASQHAIDQALLDIAAAPLAERASLRTPAHLSVRTLTTGRHLLTAVMLLLLAGYWLAGPAALLPLGIALLVLNAATTVTRIAALLASLRTEAAPRETTDTVVLADRRPLPVITLLIPLYREAAMIPVLRAALDRLDYPRDKLDVKLLLELSDTETRLAVETANLPTWIHPLVLPDGQPRTKPRAMNLALDFCEGEVIGILDAEDRPDPGQLRAVATHLRNAPPETACVQCQLSWFNAGESWITRCFQIEYAIWFDVLLRGWQRLGLPVPLGGTSVYFRRSALRDLDGWDAHNVTEDADLGMRLARRGMTCAVLTSTTEEEANTAMLPWIRQRSRWLKGYLLTWLNHMRAPARLWRDLGPVGFFGLNVLFLGGAVTYLAMPVFWVALSMTVLTGQSVFGDGLPPWAVTTITASLITGQVVMLGCAALALWRRRSLHALGWLITLPVYWTLGAVAAWKAVVEIAVAPFYWDKTRHGVTRHGTPVGQVHSPGDTPRITAAE